MPIWADRYRTIIKMKFAHPNTNKANRVFPLIVCMYTPAVHAMIVRDLVPLE